MKKKVLILGANPETVSLIKKAQKMGLCTIVTDYNPRAFAKKFADEACNINAVDVDALEILAKEKKVDGILVGVAESLLPAYCELCKRMNMPCYSTLDKFEIMSNKNYFKKQCRKYNVPTIKEYNIDKIDKIKYPVIVKPTDSCSSKGITICHNKQELFNGIKYAYEFSSSKQCLIEEYMTGDEVISYYVIQDGNPIFVGMCDRYTYKQKDRVQLPTAYIFPSRYINSYINYSDIPIKNLIKGIGLKNGSIFFQCFVDKNGIVRTYEPGYRLNGAQEHLIISHISGIDAKELYINFSLNGSVSKMELSSMANPNPKKISCKLSPLVKTGKISKIIGLDIISKFKNVISINPSYSNGDTVDGYGTLKQIVCRFFIVSDSKKELIKTINDIYKEFHVFDDSGNEMLIGNFDTYIIDNFY